MILCIIYFVIWTNEVQITKNTTIALKRGEYKFHVYGAQGGSGYSNGVVRYEGGSGAFVSGNLHFNKETTLNIIVGTKGLIGNQTNRTGGLPDGGESGSDTGWSGFDNDYAGGGGGSSQVLDATTNEKIFVAGAGGGSSGRIRGCGGGPLNHVICYIFDEETNISSCTSVIQGAYGTYHGRGVNGLNSMTYPTGGGGGGYYGGRVYSSVACGGSSFYSSIVKNANVVPSYNSNAGLVTYDIEYECMDECDDCESGETCSKCSGSKALSSGRCVDVCPDGETNVNNVCESCTNNCATCSGTTKTCTSCSGEYKLYGASCIKTCPHGTFSKENVCLACPSACPDCTSFTNCTMCVNDLILHNGKCYKRGFHTRSYQNIFLKKYIYM